MSWSCGTINGRDVGYGVPAECDHPRCHTKIDRGLGYICGQMHGTSEYGCGLYFCQDHRSYVISFRDGTIICVCTPCHWRKPPYKPKPDIEEWIRHKLTDPSWKPWRELYPYKVLELQLNL